MKIGGKDQNIWLFMKLMVDNITIYGLVENISIYDYLWNFAEIKESKLYLI